MEELAYVGKLKEWVVANGMDFITNIIAFLIILLIGSIAIKVICAAVKRVLEKSKRVSAMLRRFTIDSTRKVLWVVVLMIGLRRLGLDMAPIIAGLGVTGFILGFAFKDALGNLAAGVMILLNEPYQLGDVIDAGGKLGAVKDLNLMATILDTPDNKRITIPNSAVWGQAIINYTTNDTRRVDLVAGISYGSDINKAKETISKAVLGVNGVLADPAPTIEVVEMADSSVNLVVRPWCKTADYWKVYFACNQGIKEALDSVGIEIPFPQIDVHQK